MTNSTSDTSGTDTSSTDTDPNSTDPNSTDPNSTDTSDATSTDGPSDTSSAEPTEGTDYAAAGAEDYQGVPISDEEMAEVWTGDPEGVNSGGPASDDAADAGSTDA